ncbi:uncharacterized protein LOC104926127 [Larimichthys crocea]|uniref:uncharacterized protein LOC104926127 n=1 Tax=Larimichthys crocea TaxID=215358 RepID=UPI000901BF30|nr:uncharacterized protein LOC104926127 [Larimichthys crocea]
MQRQRNKRGYNEDFVDGHHLKLNDLKEEALRVGLEHGYLYKENIPAYPRPEFHVSHLNHDTNGSGCSAISRDNGFKNPLKDSLLWWSLVVGPDEITSAERRLLETTYPHRTEWQSQMQQSFLGKFATSQAFQKTSRLGSYRFTFPLEEVLQAYSDQFCSGAQPVMRVFKTILYKKEVVYAVLVHSPADQERFSHFPLLTDHPDSVCTYKDGCFIWRSQAMCKEHRYELVLRPDQKQIEAEEVRCQYYVWDNVAIALQVDEQVLKFDCNRLRENLKFCEKAEVTIARVYEFENYQQAQTHVADLWPDNPSPLEKAEEEPAKTEQKDNLNV